MPTDARNQYRCDNCRRLAPAVTAYRATGAHNSRQICAECLAAEEAGCPVPRAVPMYPTDDEQQIYDLQQRLEEARIDIGSSRRGPIARLFDATTRR